VALPLRLRHEEDRNGQEPTKRKHRSCGCYGRQTGRMNTTHGHLKSYHATSEYLAWRGMLARCYQPHSDGFRWYGGKGIRVCKRWRSDFAAFLADVGLKPARRMVFSRKDKDDDYKPGNCEWAIAQSSKSPARPGGANQNRAREVDVLRAPRYLTGPRGAPPRLLRTNNFDSPISTSHLRHAHETDLCPMKKPGRSGAKSSGENAPR
jgi:hypothetical protein